MGPRLRRALGPGLMALGMACTEPPGPDVPPLADTTSVPPSKERTNLPAAPPASAFELAGLDELRPRRRLSWPVLAVHVTSSFGWRVDPVSGRGVRLHRGVDFRGAIGDLVVSIGDGTVSVVGHDPFLGNLVIVDHGDGLQSLYGHLSDVLVVDGAPVERGAALGLVGNTGRSAAPHLHLTVKLDGIAIDPLAIIGEPQHRPAALLGPQGDPASPPATVGTSAPAAPVETTSDAPSPRSAPASRLPHRSDDGGP